MQKLVNKISAEIKRLTTDKNILGLLGKQGVKIIQVRTSQGYGVDGGSKKKLAPLKESTVKNRKRYKNKLASGVGPKKSALTFTGEMIESIAYKISSNIVKIFLKGRHKDSKLTNEELAAIHEDGSMKGGSKRPFMHFSDKEEKVLNGIARREIKKSLRNKF